MQENSTRWLHTRSGEAFTIAPTWICDMALFFLLICTLVHVNPCSNGGTLSKTYSSDLNNRNFGFHLYLYRNVLCLYFLQVYKIFRLGWGGGNSGLNSVIFFVLTFITIELKNLEIFFYSQMCILCMYFRNMLVNIWWIVFRCHENGRFEQ